MTSPNSKPLILLEVDAQDKLAISGYNGKISVLPEPREAPSHELP